MAKRRQPEREITQQIVRLLKSLGGEIYKSSTTRRRGDYQGTMQTPGIPDLEIFMPPPKARPADNHVLVKIEVKAQKGRMSPAQQRYRQLCLLSNTHHIVGGFDEVLDWLISHAYLESEQVLHERSAAS